jgi:hypothetical protein
MTKPTNPPTPPGFDPFKNAPKFNPFRTDSPLPRVAEQARQIGVNLETASEAARSSGIPADIDAGRAAPRFESRPTPAPFPTRTDAPVPVKPAAGGSKA